MKHYFQPIALIHFSIALLTSCQKERPGSIPTNDAVATQGLNNDVDNPVNANKTATSGTSVVIGGLKYYDLTVSTARITAGRLYFTITNKGTLIAPTCKAQINYRCNSVFKTVYVSIPNKGVSIETSVPIEAVCFESDIQFTVTIDYNNTVNESNESNNTFSSVQIN